LLVQEKVSASQLMFMLIPFIIATELLAGPGLSAQFAKQDAWLSMILSSVGGILPIFIITALALRYPDMTIMEYTEKILGKWLGKLIGLFYVYSLFIHETNISDELMSIITLFTNPRTPRIVTIAMFGVLCGVAVFLGIEVMARFSEHMVPIIAISVFVVLLLLIPDMKPSHLQPVMGHGLLPMVRGAVIPSAWMGEIVFVGFFLPYVNDLKKARTFALLAIGINTLIITVITVVTLLVNCSLTGTYAFPFYEAVRYVSIGGFVERIDPVILAVWVFGGFIKESLFLWTLCVSLSQLFGLNTYRTLVVPVTLIIIAGSLWEWTNAPDMMNWIMYTFPPFSLVIDILIPSLLLLVDSLRKWRVKTI
jgi:spore germination protein KB